MSGPSRGAHELDSLAFLVARHETEEAEADRVLVELLAQFLQPARALAFEHDPALTLIACGAKCGCKCGWYTEAKCPHSPPFPGASCPVPQAREGVRREVEPAATRQHCLLTEHQEICWVRVIADLGDDRIDGRLIGLEFPVRHHYRTCWLAGAAMKCGNGTCASGGGYTGIRTSE